MAIILPNTRNALGVPNRYSDLAAAGLRYTPPAPEQQYTYESWDVTGNSAQLYETNIDLADYQYNEDGLELHVVPDGYIAVSGGFSGFDRFGIKTDTTLWRILAGGGEVVLSESSGWDMVAGDGTGIATLGGYAYLIDSQGLTGLGGSFDRISGRHGGGYVALGVAGGYLYRMDDISTPIDGPGYTDVSGMLNLYEPWNGGFAIKNGNLMGIKADYAGVVTASRLDQYNLTDGWTAVTGYHAVEESGYQSWFYRGGYGIRNSALHRIYSTNIDGSGEYAPIIAAYVHRAWMVSPDSAVVIRKVPAE
ncbi:hypothetical protein [Oligosphaera ethanolica]|uniref:Uncharacterized protein n=1 Tax=Oligosphaera ethanolica TaxID=760260 RepID=A0AAE3VIP6_9BACT|nr:hypothetical protein [Oligosphaera ethanolica]MDQ0291008.1 hypothetical protein [Oligosphaera ethanolica]